MQDIAPELIESLSDTLHSAICLLDALAKMEAESIISTDDLVRAARIAHVRRSEAISVLTTFEHYNIVQLRDSHYRRTKTIETVRLLQAALRGAEIQKTISDKQLQLERPELVLTRPKAPSRLEGSIECDSSLVVHIEDTSEAFTSLAASAKESLTIMTPFLDETGAKWAISLFSQTRPDVRREMILRFLGNPDSDLYPRCFDWIRNDLRGLNVKVYDFAIPRDDSPEFFETFHAKVVCEDGSRAYVGSANLNRHSKETSMELGIVATGRAAERIGRILDKVKRIAPQIEY